MAVAMLSGENGMRISRAAFAVMIKFSNLQEDFQNIVNEVDLTWEDFKDDPEKDKKVIALLKGMSHFDNIFKRWESGSQMRKWIADKKKNLAERLTKEVEKEFYQKKKEAKEKLEKEKEEAEKKKAEEEEKKGGEEKKEENKEEEKKEEKKEEEKKEEEIVDTSVKPAEGEEQPKEADEETLTPEEKEQIENESYNKTELELGKIYDKIIEKAEFLVKNASSNFLLG